MNKNKNVLWIVLGVIIFLFVGYSFLGFGTVETKKQCDSFAMSDGDINQCVSVCTPERLCTINPYGKNYCSRSENTCMSYEECQANGEPSISGWTCFLGV